jgi:branched-chain amino acid transport system substrate-binding protein
MALNDINGAGGIDVGGKKVKIEVVREDTASDRAAGVALLKKVAVQQDVLAIIGPSATNLLVGMAPVCEENKTVCMATGSAAPWPAFNDYTFRNNIISAITVPKVIKELKDKYNLKTMAITYDTANDFSVGDKAVTEQTAKEQGINITATESYRTGDTDFSSQITKILPGRPELWWLGGTANEDTQLIRQARQRGYKGIMAGGPNVTDPIIFKNSEGMAQGVITFFPLDLQSPRPEVQKFVKDYQTAHNGTQPSSFVALGYDAVVLFAVAVKRAGTTTDRQKFRDALGATKDVTGIQGSYTYNGKGDNQTPSFSLQVMDKGQFVPLSQYQGQLQP